MKKFLKIALIFILVVFILLLVTPIFFKKPIMNLVKDEINKTVNAKVDFDLNLSLIRGFPNLYIGLKNVKVIGVGDFKKDTLIAFKTFSVKVDIISAIHKNIKVKSVFLDSPRISACVLKNGKANWDIMKASAAKTPANTAKSSPIDFKANLKKFEISHAYIKYQDDTANMSAEIKDLNFFLSGNFSAKQTDMTVKSDIASLDFMMSGIRYLKHAKVGFAATLAADLEKSIYSVKDNVFKLNDLSLSLEGVVKMIKDDIDVDMKFKTNKADFRTLLSMVPAVYMKDFPKVKTEGTLKLNGFAKGTYNKKQMPNVGLALKVENAMFKYPSLPKDVRNINVDMKMFYDGTKMDNSTVDINKFHLEMAGNPFDIVLHVKTPVSDMQVAGSFKGKIDFNTLTSVVPLDSMTLKGLLECNVDMAGRMSSIQKKKYEEFKADGTLKLSNFVLVSKDFPQGVKIVTTTMAFSPKFVELTSFDAYLGKSDFKLTGKLEKFIPYMFSKDTLVGNLNFSSTFIDVNELMGPPKKTKVPQKKDTTQLSLVQIPGNVNFTLNSKIAQINYDKLKITKLTGAILVKKSKAVLKDLNMELLQGSMLMNGQYNTQDMKTPFFDFDLKMKEIDIPSTYTAFNTVEKLAPIAQNCKGKISVDMNIKSQIDNHMMPVYKTMNGKGRLQSKSIELTNNKAFDKIADALKNDKFRKFTLNNVDVSFEIKDGRVYVSPFDTKIGTTKLNISGDQGFDQTLNYLIKAGIPRSDIGGAANGAINDLTAKAAAKGLNIKPGDYINVGIKVVGTFSKPEVKLDTKGSSKSATSDLKDQKIDEVKKEGSQKAKEQAEKLVKDAEVEAQKVRDAGKSLAETTRQEANNSADQLVNQATNPLTKAAAKKGAEKIRKEGDAKANKIIDEANAKADAMVNKAKEDAAKIK